MFGLEKQARDPEKADEMEERIREIEIRLDAMSAETEAHLDEIGLTPEEVKKMLESPHLFPQELWELLQDAEKSFWSKLRLELDNIRDVKLAEERYREANVPQSWLQVR